MSRPERPQGTCGDPNPQGKYSAAARPVSQDRTVRESNPVDQGWEGNPQEQQGYAKLPASVSRGNANAALPVTPGTMASLTDSSRRYGASARIGPRAARPG